MNLYVKHIADIKKKIRFVIDVRTVRFLFDKIRTFFIEDDFS